MWYAFLRALNSIHLPTIVVAFFAWLVGSFVVNFNGAPVDLATTQGRLDFLMALFTAFVIFLQKATPATPKS